MADAATQHHFQLVKHFSVTSLVIILLFTLAISSVVSLRSSALVLHKREQYALLLAENLNHQVMVQFVIPALRDYGGINVGSPAQFGLLDLVVKNTIQSFQVCQVNILDLDGNIIYSTQPDYIGRLGMDQGPFHVAAAGGHASTLDPPWDSFEMGTGLPRIFKTFIPLRDQRRLTAELGPPRAVFEIALDVTEDFKEIWFDQKIIMGTLLTMMALLFVILRSIVIRGQRIESRRTAQEATLKEQLQQSERLASLGRMIAGVAHEIRTPLGIVRSTAELLGSKIEYKQKALAEVIVEESTRLNCVVTEFLDFARPQQARLRSVLVEEVLERNLAALAVETERAGVEVVRRFQANAAPALADQDLLYRAFLNVFNNAIQAMQGQSDARLVISTRRMQQDGHWWVVVIVEDNGPGFDSQSSGKLFDPFFTTKEQGTGLGLSIVRSLVDSHQGKIELGASSEGGAKVEIRLKIAQE